METESSPSILSARVPTRPQETPFLFAKYALGGALSCVVTHVALVPIDVVKTRLQLQPEKYQNMTTSFRKIVAEEGLRGLLLGFSPTLFGYFVQGGLKYGLYEVFKGFSKDFLGEESFHRHRTAAYLSSGALAETIADLALCPFEAVRIRIVSQPGFARGVFDGLPRIAREEGLRGLYKGLLPIVLKQVPYTMVKFTVFEHTVQTIYGSISTPKEDLSVATQLSISVFAGLVGGAASAVASHPADTILSVLNRTSSDRPILAQILNVVRDLGLRRLFLGLGARILMVATMAAGQFLIYDGTKACFCVQTYLCLSM